MNYADMFHHLHPGFFEKKYIRALPEDEIYEELMMPLADFSIDAMEIPVPAHITFGKFAGDIAELQESVRLVEEDWVQYFQKGDHVFCAYDGGKVVSFCLLDDFGEYQGMKIGAPGCVGTIPSHRNQGIGLKLVQLATQRLKEAGCDQSYIHYTAVGPWYAKLGYKTIVRWNCKGIQ